MGGSGSRTSDVRPGRQPGCASRPSRRWSGGPCSPPCRRGSSTSRYAASISNPTAMDFAPTGGCSSASRRGAAGRQGRHAPADAVRLADRRFGRRARAARGRVRPGLRGQPIRLRLLHRARPGRRAAHNRVSRFTADPANPDVALAGSETPILDLDNLSTATNHNGGAIHFGPDGKLYVAVGENANGANAQTLTNRLGKMLRINPDGTIPTDNPFFNTATGANRAIWALGLRNPFTFAFQPGTGRDVHQRRRREHVGGDRRRAGGRELRLVDHRGLPHHADSAGQLRGPAVRLPPPDDRRGPRPGRDRDHRRGVLRPRGRRGASRSRPVTTATTSSRTRATAWIRRLDAGTANSPCSRPAGPNITDLKVGPDGGLYYLERGSNSVRRVEYTGITAAAGARTASPAR